MDQNKYITVGKSSFNVDSLKGKTQKECLQQYHYLHKDIVKHAHAMCNPKKKTTKKSDK